MNIKRQRSAIAFFGLIFFSLASQATEQPYWMNDWDADCYDNGVNTCREDWYKTPQGSHLIMWEVFNTIERHDSTELFSSKESLSRYGFLYPENNGADDAQYGEAVTESLTEYDLPIGVLKDKSQVNGRNYVGLSCAACHTGAVTHEGDKFYIEGGQGNLDTIRFLSDLRDSVEANNTNGSKRRRYNKRFFWYSVLNPDLLARPVVGFAAQSYLSGARDYMDGWVARNEPTIENGPMRLDAFGAIVNQLHVAHSDRDDELAIDLSAPVSLPYIWNVTDLECVQNNCVATDPIDRNVGEVLGVFGSMKVDDAWWLNDTIEVLIDTLGLNFLKATPKVDNLFSLEKSLAKLKSPKWPNTFPALDPLLVSEGRAIYTNNCASCHMDTSDGVDEHELTAPNSIGRRSTIVTRMNYLDVGTDPAFAEDYGLAEMPSGWLGAAFKVGLERKGRFDSFINPATGEPLNGVMPENFNAIYLLGTATTLILENHYNSPGFKLKAKRAYPGIPKADAVTRLRADYAAGHVDRGPVDTLSYRAKPLDGIAFTGPYLHNGSVRTLFDLLKTPEQRPASFSIGSTEYDVADAGYIDDGDFVFDTSLRGNYSGGHTYGTTLPEQDKLALLEYLKSL